MKMAYNYKPDGIAELAIRYLDVQEALARWKGARAFLWEYRLTHHVITIRLEYPRKSENLHVMCGSCTRISSSITWDDAQIELRYVEPNGYASIILEDQRAAFAIECAHIEVARNVPPLFWVKFDVPEG
jgi:hypothetical protein